MGIIVLVVSEARNLRNVRSRPATFHSNNHDYDSGNGDGDGHGRKRDHLQLFGPQPFFRVWRFHL